jgi:hypothetical protein
MALGTATRTAAKSVNSSKPLYADYLEFDGDDAYVAGGTIAFDTYVRNVTGIDDNRTVIGVIPLDCGGYEPRYIQADGGTLIVYEQSADGNPADEIGAGDQSGIAIKLLVLSI